jgi:Glycosyl hydrolases family 16
VRPQHLALPVVLGCLATLGAAVHANAADTAPAQSPAQSAELFDDFAYADADDPRIPERSWTVRTGGGGPGVPGATWAKENVTFPQIDGGQAMQLTASTNGSAEGTRQAEMYHQRKFFEGTYAARVRFSDTPTSGPDGDQMVQTFFTITPLDAPNDPNYGEIDFEYLPNGGWGEPGSTFFMTTWETYQPDPWVADNIHDAIRSSYDGWHDLLVQVADGHVRYYIDGTLSADHSGKYYPETPMSINFNHWFISGGLIGDSTPRGYVEQVDWLYHSKDEVLALADVQQRVEAFRSNGVDWVDTVPAG